MNFKFEDNVQGINKYLKNYMDILADSIPIELYKAMEYSLFAGGKRLRPLLLIETARVFSDNIVDAIPLACGIEMIHTYSLIHDDLPAMDNDDYRRGKLTNHKVFGENIAILAGDALLNYAYEIMIGYTVELKNESKIKQYIQGLMEITGASGTQGMIVGQVADILNDGNKIDKEKLDYINGNKTGALIRSAVRAGAIVNQCDSKRLIYLTKYSEILGLAFQIVDDILDVVGNPEKLGKNIGSDEKNKKSTYVDFFGLEESNIIVDELLKNALSNLEKCNIKDSILIDLAYFICKRDY